MLIFIGCLIIRYQYQIIKLPYNLCNFTSKYYTCIDKKDNSSPTSKKIFFLTRYIISYDTMISLITCSLRIYNYTLCTPKIFPDTQKSTHIIIYWYVQLLIINSRKFENESCEVLSKTRCFKPKLPAFACCILYEITRAKKVRAIGKKYFI